MPQWSSWTTLPVLRRRTWKYALRPTILSSLDFVSDIQLNLVKILVTHPWSLKSCNGHRQRRYEESLVSHKSIGIQDNRPYVANAVTGPENDIMLLSFATIDWIGFYIYFHSWVIGYVMELRGGTIINHDRWLWRYMCLSALSYIMLWWFFSHCRK